MIRAMMFDLDGTLVQSEKMKALSYANAVQEILGLDAPDERAIEAYREIVGASRDVATKHIIDALGLEDALRARMADFDATEPWQVLVAMRVANYKRMTEDPQVIRDNQWVHVVDLLRVARATACSTALATMSYRDEALRVLQALDVLGELDVVLTRDDVTNPKPDPEIYLMALERLGIPANEALVMEDSPAGVQAGLAAGANVIAMATPFTEPGLAKAQLLPEEWTVRDPTKLMGVVERRIDQHNRDTHADA